MNPDKPQGTGDTQTQMPPAPSLAFEGDGTLVLHDGRKFVPFERYTGLQGPMQKKDQEIQRLRAQITELSEQRETEVSSIKAELDTLKQGSSGFETQIQELSTAKTGLEAQVAQFQRQLETNKLFLSEKYQPLIPSLEKGTLRLDGLEGDALTQYLDTFLAERQTLLGQNPAQTTAGGSPPPPAGGGRAEPTFEELRDQVMQMSPTDPKYTETFKAYMDALAKKQ